MERWTLVTKVLRKFTIKELTSTVSRLDILPADFRESLKDYANAKKKEAILELYIDSLKRQTDPETALGHLDLLHCSSRSTQKSWTIYALQDKNVQDEPNLGSPDDLQRQLDRRLNNADLRSKVAVQLHDGAYWLRIGVSDIEGRGRKKVTTAFCVHYNGMNSMAFTGLTRWHMADILEALGGAFEFADSEATALQDRNLKGLFQLFHDKENPYFYQVEAVQNPLATDKTPEPVKEQINKRIIHLQKENAVVRKRYNNSKFGADERPPIKRLVYETVTPFAGLEFAPQMRKHGNKPFRCRVVFDGPNVIDGLPNMVMAGIAITPLPRFLADIRTMGRTRFTVRHNVQENERT